MRFFRPCFVSMFITQTLGRRLHNVVEWEKGPAVEHNSSLGLSDDGR
jgi:hypothetical protein